MVTSQGVGPSPAGRAGDAAPIAGSRPAGRPREGGFGDWIEQLLGPGAAVSGTAAASPADAGSRPERASPRFKGERQADAEEEASAPAAPPFVDLTPWLGATPPLPAPVRAVPEASAGTAVTDAASADDPTRDVLALDPSGAGAIRADGFAAGFVVAPSPSAHVGDQPHAVTVDAEPSPALPAVGEALEPHAGEHGPGGDAEPLAPDTDGRQPFAARPDAFAVTAADGQSGTTRELRSSWVNGGGWQARETAPPSLDGASQVVADGEAARATAMPSGAAAEGSWPRVAIDPAPADAGRAELRHAAARAQQRLRASMDGGQAFPTATDAAKSGAGASTPPVAPAVPVGTAIDIERPAASRSSLSDLAVAPYPTAAFETRLQAATLEPRVEGPPQASSLDDAELPDQIVQSLRLQITSGGGEARVHLRPEYLGELTVRVLVEDGVVSARLEAERPAVRDWIERHEVSLRQALGEHGLTLDTLNVSDRGRDETRDRGDGEPASHHDSPERQRRPRRHHDGNAPRFEVTA